MINMDFTTTAVARHAIFEQTLSSFSRNLKGINLKNCRLIVNVDPLPPKGKRKDVIKVAKKYFGEVKYNFPDKPNFTAAYNWVWANAETEYIFNLEDDWLLTKEVDVPSLLKYFNKNDKLLQILFRAYKYHYRTCALSPSIIHRRLYSAVGGNMSIDINPETQLRGERFGIKMPTRGGKGGVSNKGLIRVHPKQAKKVILQDLGRNWIRKTKLKKSGGGKKARFTKWEIK